MTDAQKTVEEQNQAAAGAAAGAPANDTPHIVFKDADSFNKRIAQEARKQLREMGIDDPSAVKEMLSKATELAAQAEAQKKAQMTEIDRVRAEATESAAQLAATQADLVEAKLEAKLNAAFGKFGIKNTGYGAFKVQSELKKNADLDIDTYLSQLLGEETEKYALGAAQPPAVAAPPANVQVPQTTTPRAGVAPVPPVANQAPTAKLAKDLSPSEWTAYKQANSIPV